MQLQPSQPQIALFFWVLNFNNELYEYLYYVVLKCWTCLCSEGGLCRNVPPAESDLSESTFLKYLKVYRKLYPYLPIKVKLFQCFKIKMTGPGGCAIVSPIWQLRIAGRPVVSSSRYTRRYYITVNILPHGTLWFLSVWFAWFRSHFWDFQPISVYIL